MPIEKIGEWVRLARKSAKLTGDQLAEKLGTTKANVSHLETGKHDPDFRTLLRIQDITGYALLDVRPGAAWPFRRIRPEQLATLTREQLDALEMGIEGILAALRPEPSRKREALVA